MVVLCFSFPENSRFVQSNKIWDIFCGIIQWVFTLARMAFCRSNRKQHNPSIACEAYRQSTENLKSYMQRQWSLVGGMAGTFREME